MDLLDFKTMRIPVKKRKEHHTLTLFSARFFG